MSECDYLSERIRHEADYIDATPLDTRAKRDVTIQRLRQCAADVDYYANEYVNKIAALKRKVELAIERIRAEDDPDIGKPWIVEHVLAILTAEEQGDE